MKKFFMFAAMASVALASCVKNEPAMTVAQQDEIAFDLPVVAPAVKSVTETAEGAFDQDFKVWGYFSATQMENFTNATPYMPGVVISFDDENDVWKSAGTKYYWPNNGYLTFVGYAPSNAVGTYDVAATGLTITDYVVDAAADVDLLVSQISYNNTKPNSDNDHGTATYKNGAEIVFEHALSSVQFTVKTLPEILAANYTLVVKKISILGAQSKGNFIQKLEGEVGTPTQMAPSTTTNDGWAATDPVVTANYVAYTNATGITLTANSLYTNGLAEQSANTTDLILLPQVIGDDVKLEVVYTLANATMTTPAEQTTTVDLNETTVNQWLRGKRYTYNLTVKLDEITFDPEVSAWVTGAGQDNDVTPDYN